MSLQLMPGSGDFFMNEEVHMRYLSEHNRINETPIPFEVVPYPSEFKIIDNNKVIRNITYGEI